MAVGHERIVAVAAVVTVVAANTRTLIASVSILVVAVTVDHTAALVASVLEIWFTNSSAVVAVVAAATRAIALIAFVARSFECFGVLRRAQQFQQCFCVWEFRLWW